jgi:hypothetical protein
VSKYTVDPLDYYAQHGSITDPGQYAERLEGLPDGIVELCGVVQGLMLHHMFASFYGLELPEERLQAVELRHVRRLLAGILELDGRPLTVARPPEKRLLINCRDFATVLCAMLRQQGVPARARCGFARYFERCPEGDPGFHVDHWVCEYWDAEERRWVLVDAELDENERAFCHIEIDPLDVPRDQFLVAGKAWQLCREGRADPETFGFGPDPMHGLWYVQSQLVRDLAALNRMELLCWDCWGLGDWDRWGLGHADPAVGLSDEEMEVLDRVAVLTQGGNAAFAELRRVYENDRRLRVPRVVHSYTRAGLRLVDLIGEPPSPERSLWTGLHPL